MTEARSDMAAAPRARPSILLRFGYRALLLVVPRSQRGIYRRLDRKSAVLYFFMQRIVRINSHVPWPVHWSSMVLCPERIVLTNGRPWPGYSAGQYIQAINGIEFGNNVRMGPGVKLISADHDVSDYERHSPAPPIRIGDNVWLGADVKVMSGVRIGNHVVVGAGAVVTKDVPDNSLVAGVPARVIRPLGPYAGPSGSAGAGAARNGGEEAIEGSGAPR